MDILYKKVKNNNAKSPIIVKYKNVHKEKHYRQPHNCRYAAFQQIKINNHNWKQGKT